MIASQSRPLKTNPITVTTSQRISTMIMKAATPSSETFQKLGYSGQLNYLPLGRYRRSSASNNAQQHAPPAPGAWRVVSVSVRPPVGLVIRMLPGQRAEDFTTHAPATVTPMRLRGLNSCTAAVAGR
jgi:hypothetical protein